MKKILSTVGLTLLSLIVFASTFSVVANVEVYAESCPNGSNPSVQSGGNEVWCITNGNWNKPYRIPASNWSGQALNGLNKQTAQAQENTGSPNNSNGLGGQTTSTSNTNSTSGSNTNVTAGDLDDIRRIQILPFDCLVHEGFLEETGTGRCKQGLLNGMARFLLNIAPALAIIVIMWGGYKYFFSAFSDGKAQGIQAIQAGAIGLGMALLAEPIIDLVADILGADGGSATGFDAQPLVDVLLGPVTNFLVGTSSVIAVLVIIWGGYQYFFSAFPGGKKDGVETIGKGVTGLVVVLVATQLVRIVEATLGVQQGALNLSPDAIINVIYTIVTAILIPISGAVTVFFFIWGAYLWLTAGGNSGQVKKAQDQIRNALIGLVVILLATTVSQLIIYFVTNFNLG